MLHTHGSGIDVRQVRHVASCAPEISAVKSVRTIAIRYCARLQDESERDLEELRREALQIVKRQEQHCTRHTRTSVREQVAGRLAIYLGRLRADNIQNPFASFHELSTVEFPRGNGFVISAGLSASSCRSTA
jgi:hypothetical protein